MTQTPREVILKTMQHLPNPENIMPYTAGAECPILAAKLNDHYGGWYGKNLTNFITYPMWISTTGEVPLDREHYSRDIFGSIWYTGKLPWHLEKPILEEPSFEGYTFPSIDQFLEPSEKSNAKGKAREHIKNNPDTFHVISMGWGLFEHSWRMRGFEEALCDCALEENFYAELVDKISDRFVGMVDYCKDVPADAFLFGDDWGSQLGVIIGPEKWRKFIKPAWKKVYDRVHAQGKYVISHSCGSIYDIIPDLIEIGLDMHESVQPEAYGMNPFKLKEEFGDKLAFWGTLGSQSVIPFWKPDEIEAHIHELKRVMNKNGGYILAPAKPFQPETPLENAIRIIDVLSKIND